MYLDGIKWDFPFCSDDKINWGKIEKTFPFVKPMKDCQQNPKYHGEGDVWSHTKLALEQLVNNPEWQQLPPTERSVLFVSVLLHDVEKPSCSKEEEGEIRSKKHSVLGARMARRLLWDTTMEGYIKAPWIVREYVSNMVLLHMLPFFFFSKLDPSYSVIAASQVVSNKMLFLMGWADSHGRICSDHQDIKNAADALDLFEDYCSENKCFDRPKQFLYPEEDMRFRFLYERKGSLFDSFNSPIKGHVIFMSGLPASGKDYTIKAKYGDMPVVSLDQIRKRMGAKHGEEEGEVVNIGREDCKVLMREGKNFVFNATNTIKDMRKNWIDLFRKYGYRIETYYIERPLLDLLERNKKRDNPVPEEIILEKFEKLDVPTLLECHSLIYDV